MIFTDNKQHTHFQLKHYCLYVILILLSGNINANTFKLAHKANCFTISNINTIYIGTQKGLYQFKERDIMYVPHFEDEAISALFSLEYSLYIGTRDGDVYKYENNKKQLLSNFNSEISSIQIIDKKLIIGTKGSGLWMIENNSKRNFLSSNSILDNYINDIKLRKNEILLATDNGIFTLDLTNYHIKNIVNYKEVLDPLITTIWVKNNNEFFFGTSLGYVYRNIKNKTVQQCNVNSHINYINQNELCTNDGVFEIANCIKKHTGEYIGNVTDLENNKWYLKSNELEFSASSANIFNLLWPLKIKNVHSIYSNGEEIFLTPDEGLLTIHKNNTFEYKKMFISNKHIDITSFFLQNDSTLWIGTMGAGLLKYHTKFHTFEQIMLNTDISSTGILSISGNKTELFVSTLNGAWYTNTYSNKSLQFSSIEEKYKIKKSYVYQIKMDSKGRVWLATEGKGILLLYNEKLHSFNPNYIIKAKSFYSIEEDNQGNIYFGSDKEGLYILTKTKMYNLNDKSGLLQNNILGIASNDQHCIILHDSSYTILNTKTFQSTFAHYPTGYHTEINSITKWNKHILIGCDSGILSISNLNKISIIVAQPTFSNIMCNNISVNKSKKLFNYHENNFVFNLSYRYNNPNIPIYFRYKLEGYNKDWVETKDNIILFNMLHHGKYKLRYQVANNPMYQFANEIQYTFEIKKPFWKTIWFWITMGMILYISIRYILKYRIKQATILKEIEQQKQLAEFNALKSQVNPHFLFNSFNSLLQIIEDDKEQAIEYTTLLSDLYRNILSNKDKDLILLEDELLTMQDFIKLHQVNLGKNLKLIVDTFKKNTYYLCPLSLQLLAENAIKHNIINSSNPLCIEVTIINDYLQIKNNINRKLTNIVSEKIGLKNIQNRYKNITKRNVIIDTSEKYFIVKIPLIVK